MRRVYDEHTQDLFNRPVTGLEIGHAMANVAANHAGEEWKQFAYDSFVEYAKIHGEFTTEQVRGACSHVSAPPDKRAWGQVALRAKKNGVIESAGWTRAESKSVHGMVITLWRSKINY
jgi:hypothetical protein